MQRKWLWALVPGLALGVTGCPDVTIDEDEVGSGPPVVEFDPSNRIIPFPNNLLLDPATGKVNLPASCGESPASMATRTMVLNQLDGFGTYQVAMSVTFTEPVDMATLADRVVLYKRVDGMTPVAPDMATAIPVVTIPGMSTRFTADCASSSMVPSLTIVPLVPLEQKSFYTVGLLAGIKTADGTDYGPAFTWALTRQAENPVTLVDPACDSGTGMCAIASERTPLDPSTPVGLATLNGIHRLWQAHAGAMSFLVAKGHAREDVLLAWEFRTQTVTDPLDPAVATSPAAMVNTMPLTGPIDAAPVPVSIAAAAANRAAYPFLVCTTGSTTPPVPAELNNTQCYLKLALGGGLSCTSAGTCEPAYALGTGTCAAVGCAAVGDVLAGRLRSKQYQSERPNAAVPASPIPGPWSDPVAPALVKEELLSVLITIPATAAPSAGYPTTIYQHGLGSSRTTLFAIGPQLASTGSATVAIDAVAHDSRAVQNSVDAARGCAGTPSFSTAPQCFAGFLSPDLAATRDNIRQTVLDSARPGRRARGVRDHDVRRALGRSDAHLVPRDLARRHHREHHDRGERHALDLGAQRPGRRLGRHPREHRDARDPVHARRRLDRRGHPDGGQVEPDRDAEHRPVHDRRMEGAGALPARSPRSAAGCSIPPIPRTSRASSRRAAS